MRRGERREITVDGKAFEAEYLGAGHHARAYRAGDTVYLFVHGEGECMKDAVAEWCSDMPHVPVVKRHDETRVRGREYRVYSMPYYRNVTAKDASAWAVLRTLSEAAERIRRAKYMGDRPLTTWGIYFAQDVIEDTRGKVPESVSEALTELMNAGSNYGSGVTFEFGRRNIGVDAEGRIVFRDILFDAEKVYRELVAKSKRCRAY